MPRYTARFVRMICSGWWMTPSHSSAVLRRPVSRMMPSRAYTRSRNEVQNGRMMTSSRMLWVLFEVRAMA